MKDTLVIMGNHPESRGKFDFNRGDCEIIIFNEAAKQDWIKRYDYVLQLHIPTIWRNPNNRNDNGHYDWLKATDSKVFMQKRYEDVPASIEFPKDAILSMLPNGKANGKPIREVACSPAFALAWGIYQGYKKIEIYGVELESNTEYAYQQGNFKYWVGVAVGKGIDVDTHSPMFDNPLYGYEGEVFIEYENFDRRIDEISPLREVRNGKFSAEASSLWNEFEKTLHGDNSKILIPLVQKAVIAAIDLGKIDGAIQENKQFRDKADAMLKVDNNFVFSRQEFEQRAAAAQKKIQEHIDTANMLKGQLDMVHNTIIRLAKGSPKRKSAMENYRKMLAKFLQANNGLGIFDGATQENMIYMRRLDAGIKAAGGVKSEAVILEAAK